MHKRIGILWWSDAQAAQGGSVEHGRFPHVFKALAERGIAAEAVLYRDDSVDRVRDQLMQLDGILVWVNPIEAGHNRSKLDELLRDVSARGVWVSAHPDVILKMGTKEVLYHTRELGWGSDTYLHATLDELRQQLPVRLALGKPRVLKQYRGNGGNGVWKIELSPDASQALPGPQTPLRVRHALRGSTEEETTLGELIDRFKPYFEQSGRMIDQAYQERLTDGMIRCYLVKDRVAGFGHQAVNALFPAPPGAPPQDAPQPGPRLYFPPSRRDFQPLKQTLEDTWLPAMQRLLSIETAALPLIWDADFLYGPKTAAGENTFVLCEINVSSVFPFPEDALAPLADAVANRFRQ
jgi:hypothetical protein